MTILGYVRFLTDEDGLDSQSAALKAAGAKRILKEKVSGSRADRPVLNKLLSTIGEGDVLIVSRLDHLARSTRGLLDAIVALSERGATLKSIHEPWADTTTREGRLLLTALKGIAEFERGLLVARTGAGRMRAKAQGRPLGRPSKLTPQQRSRDLADLEAGRVTQADLARRRNVSESTVSRMVGKHVTEGKGKRKPDAETQRAARDFLRRLKGKYAPIEAVLYGSRARGDHKPDSDVDIAVILKGRRGNRYEAVRHLSDAAYDTMMETGVYIQPFPIWKSELDNPALFSNPALLENIKRDGLRL